MNEETTPPKKSKKELITAVIALLVLGVLVGVVLNIYKNETESRAAFIEADTAKAGPNRVDATVKIVSADPVKGDVVVRLDLAPQGTLLAEDGVTLTRDLDLFISSATGKQVHEFRKGKRMTPVEAVLDMYGGDAMDYPFDEHDAQLVMYFETPTPAAGAPAPATANDDDVPIALALSGAVNGLAIDAQTAKEMTNDFVAVDLTIKRALTARFFSLFIMAAMWLLTAAVLFLVFHILADRRKIEIGMFSFLGALLFAFPALRNSQPGTPPIGTYGDFLAFFWAEVLIALCLLTILCVWLVRGAGSGSKA